MTGLRRLLDDPPYQSFDPAVAGRATLLRLADDTSKGWFPTTLLTRFAEPASPRLRSPRERRTCRRVGRKYEGAKDQAEW